MRRQKCETEDSAEVREEWRCTARTGSARVWTNAVFGDVMLCTLVSCRVMLCHAIWFHVVALARFVPPLVASTRSQKSETFWWDRWRLFLALVIDHCR